MDADGLSVLVDVEGKTSLAHISARDYEIEGDDYLLVKSRTAPPSYSAAWYADYDTPLIAKSKVTENKDIAGPGVITSIKCRSPITIFWDGEKHASIKNIACEMLEGIYMPFWESCSIRTETPVSLSFAPNCYSPEKSGVLRCGEDRIRGGGKLVRGLTPAAPVYVDGCRTPAHALLYDSNMCFFEECIAEGRFLYYSSAALPKLVRTDVVNVCEESSRRSHRVTTQNESKIFELSSEFEMPGNELTALHLSHLNKMRFEIQVDTANCGVLLRRAYDQFHGRQRARVIVDGEFAGWWYNPEENRTKRWAERDFYISQEFTAGKSKLEVEIDPPAGSSLWSVSSYEVLCFKT